MFKRLLLVVTIVFSTFTIAMTAQIPAESETTIYRPEKSEIIEWMKQVSKMPAAEQNEKASAALKGISASDSKTPRSDFQLCIGLAYLGNTTAQRCAGYAYEKGIGIIDDLMEAYVWFSLASGDDALNDSDASRLLLTLNLNYPAPSEEELETTVSEQKKNIAAYQKEVNK